MNTLSFKNRIPRNLIKIFYLILVAHVLDPSSDRDNTFLVNDTDFESYVSHLHRFKATVSFNMKSTEHWN